MAASRALLPSPQASASPASARRARVAAAVPSSLTLAALGARLRVRCAVLSPALVSAVLVAEKVSEAGLAVLD